MSLHKRFAFSLALVTIIGLTASVAGAETVLKGTFDLPEQAYWGSTALPAGQYTLVMNKEASGIRLITLQGEGVTTTIIAPAGYEESSGATCLRLEEINGNYVVRELASNALGRAYRFGVSKSVRNMSLTRNAAPPITVPVSSAGL